MNPDHELLLCHVTGQDHWDLPKGGLDLGETPLQAALRETREETSLVLDGASLIDLGRHAYRPKKDLHLFATLMPRFDLAPLVCVSQFSQRHSGRRLPEMDGYVWAPFARIVELCTPKMTAVLTSSLALPQVLAVLQVPQPSELAA